MSYKPNGDVSPCSMQRLPANCFFDISVYVGIDDHQAKDVKKRKKESRRKRERRAESGQSGVVKRRRIDFDKPLQPSTPSSPTKTQPPLDHLWVYVGIPQSKTTPKTS